MAKTLNGQSVRGSEKYCPRCCNWKTFESFGRNRGKPTGLQPYCKACTRRLKPRDIEPEIKDSRKLCPKCQRFVPLDNFSPNPHVPTGLKVYCDECLKSRPQTRDIQLTCEHRIMHATQGGLCVICTLPLAQKCYLDYDTNDKVCGLLCKDCGAQV